MDDLKDSKDTEDKKALPELSSAVLLDLRRQAHAISPLVRIGKSGLNDAVLEELRNQLKTHHLVKIKALNNFMHSEIPLVKHASERSPQSKNERGNFAMRQEPPNPCHRSIATEGSGDRWFLTDETDMTKKDIGRFLASQTDSYLISVVGYTFVLYKR